MLENLYLTNDQGNENHLIFGEGFRFKKGLGTVFHMLLPKTGCGF